MSRPSAMDGMERPSSVGPYLAGARAVLPFAFATLVLGISFGVLARSLGWPPPLSRCGRPCCSPSLSPRRPPRWFEPLSD